jgi:hypothetical protein
VNVKELLERVPADRAAEERAWAVVRAAFEEREPVRRGVPRRRVMLAAAAVAAAAVAAVLSAPGRAVVDAVRRSIGIEHAAPALFRLPAPGRLLVSGQGGAWVVSADGSKRRLGSYAEAAWSPHGLFVVAATRDAVAAVEPGTGNVHWSLARPRVAWPRWGGSRVDTRVAYLTRGRLHVVAGNGVGDRDLGAVARVAPAWRPGDRLQLAYVTRGDRVRLEGAWTSRRYPSPRSLVWSRDGRQLLLVTARQLVLFDGRTGRARSTELAGVRAAAFARDGRLAVVRGRAVLLLGGERTRTLVSAPGRLAGLSWSPDGHWLVTSLPGADQWLFVGGGGRVLAVSHIARQLGGAVALDGWMPGP